MTTLDNLRRTAKRWLKALRAQDPSARDRLRRAHPTAPLDPGLRDVQHALARELGFDSWTALKAGTAKPVAGSLAVLEGLSRDVVAAHNGGDEAALRRLLDHFGGELTLAGLREGIGNRLREVPADRIPAGEFSIEHAKLLIALQAGFETWAQLARVLSPAAAADTPSSIPAGYEPAKGPGMILPVEIAAGLRVGMRDGSQSTTTAVWSMLTACRNGELTRVEELAHANPALILCDYNYMAPLHLAVREGHYAVVSFLCEHGAANPNYVTYPYRETLPTLARDRGYEDIARLVEGWYARENKDRKEEEGGEIEYGKDERRVRFERLVSLGALPEVEAMLREQPELARDPFAHHAEGILSMPANRGNRPMLELLLAHGARVPDVTKWGAWYYFKRYDIAAFLIDSGMNPRHMNVHHTTLLHDMAYTGDAQKAALLLDAGADIDAVDEEFRSTPLGLAVRFGQRKVVDLLLSRRADPNLAGAVWATPLEWARKRGHGDIEDLLRRAGARDRTAPRRPSLPDAGEAPVLDATTRALDAGDVSAFAKLLRDHRDVFETHRPFWLELDPASVVARARPARWLPVRPDLRELEAEAARAGGGPEARLAVARSYGADSWERLATACRLIDAIWRDDIDLVRELVQAQPSLLHEDAGVRHGNWGPPMTYAANLGRNRIVRMLHAMGAKDLRWALDRAILQGQLDTARMLYEMGARPLSAAAALEGPAETLSDTGMSLLLDLGVEITPETAPTAMVLQGYGRNPQGKHRILELLVRHGVQLPDTPPMALHRGRLDLLETHLKRDPGLFSRTFGHEDIYPPALGCHADHSLALHGTPLDGAGLLHMAVEYQEVEVARWMLERGADANLRALVDAEGFGGHTPLFNSVVCLGARRPGAAFARLLLDHGADPRIRASLRKGLRFADDESVHEYRDVTAVEWGQRFHDRSVVNEEALRLLVSM